jgi:hypothetical protein
MAKKDTAEQKLLKIIEASQRAKGVASPEIAVPAVSKPSAVFNISVHQINFFLTVLVVASFIYFAFELVSGMALLNENVSIAVKNVVPESSQGVALPRGNAAGYYLEKIAVRNIFEPFQRNAEASYSGGSAMADLEFKLKNYKLVGIAWLDVPESASVMIEDTATGITQFKKEGEKLDDVTIKTIYTDGMVVGYKNEEMVIKL